MSSKTVIARIHKLLNSVESGELSPYDVERTIEAHFDALECVDSSVIWAMRRLTGRLITAEALKDEQDLVQSESVETVLTEFRGLVDSLPTLDL